MTVKAGRFAIVPILAGLATAASIAVAPVAGASSDPVQCRQSGGGTVCQKPGHSSLHAKPEVRGAGAGLWNPAWLPGYGRGQMPPPLAMG